MTTSSLSLYILSLDKAQLEAFVTGILVASPGVELSTIEHYLQDFSGQRVPAEKLAEVAMRSFNETYEGKKIL